MNQGIFNTGIVSVFQKDLDEINFKMHVLEAQNKRYREALTFYANKDSWVSVSPTCITEINDSDIDYTVINGFRKWHGGVRARAALLEDSLQFTVGTQH